MNQIGPTNVNNDMPLLEVEQLHSGYGRIIVLHGIDLTVRSNEITAVVGPNGAGKTTLANTITGFIKPKTGEIRFDGKSLTEMNPSTIARHGIGYIPQRQNVFADLTVEENLDVSSLVTRSGHRRSRDQIYELFPILWERRRQHAKTLSGGQRQMLAIGSALIANPRLLILDEPTTGLAPQIISQLIEAIVKVKDQGTALIWVVEENPRPVLSVSDRVFFLEAGVVRRSTTGRDLLAEDRWEELFLKG